MADLPPLLLPATPALLDGWCGPVVHLIEDAPGVLVGPDTGWGPWLVAPAPEWPAYLGLDVAYLAISARTNEIALDLARAECRDRVARVVLGRPFEWSVSDDDPGMEGVSGPRGLILWADGHCYCSDAESARYWGGTHVPEMPSDWRDYRRLPDGSRWVDAAALLAVVRVVLEVDRG